jgi:hypothetical protein
MDEEEYLTEEHLLELPQFNHMKPATLTRWRSVGKGPSFVRVGRKPFYRKAAVYDWLRQKEENCEHQQSAPRAMLPVQGPRGVVSRGHRLGGRKTKSDRRENS